MPWVHQGLETNARIALVFGREDRGLSNDELLLSQRVVRLHSGDAYPSLNLSHAVAVLLHELERIRRQADPCPREPPQLAEAALPPQLDACLSDAEDLLLEAGFLLEHTAKARMAKVRALLQRALARPEEVALLRGMVRQLRWAIRCNRP